MNDLSIVNFNNCILENIGWPKYINLYIDGKRYENVFTRESSNNLDSLKDGFITDITYDIEIEDPCFILFDEYAGNYFHYLTDCFSKLEIFCKLKKNIPNIKIVIIEDHLDVSYINESLHLFFENLDEFLTILPNKKIKFKNLIVPKPTYYWPNIDIPDSVYYTLNMLSEKINQDIVKPGIYISRQDTVKNSWWHNRNLKNELQLIDAIKNQLNYDIVELMDLSLQDKIKIFKSYKNIIQQNGASTANIFFCNRDINFHIISHPIIHRWANPILKNVSNHKGLNFYEYNYGKICHDITPTSSDVNNIPWEIDDVVLLTKNIIENSK
jgi:hypothetical protein